MKTVSYIMGAVEEITVGKEYYFGQLWGGEEGEAETVLESGAVAVYNEDGEEVICDFEILQEDEDILKTIVKVTGIR